MKANNAEIYGVGNLEADFQQVPLTQFFLKFSKYCCEALIIKIQQRKVKYIILDKYSKQSLFYRNCTVRQMFGRKFNIWVHFHVFENKTQKQKRQMVSDKIRG